MTEKNTQRQAPETVDNATEDFCDRVLDCIDERGTTIKPKWQFQAREAVLWLLIALAVVVGSLAVAVIVNNISDSDLPLYMQGGYHPFIAVGKLLPYFWIITLVLIAIAIEWNVKHTKKGYKFRTTTILLGTVLISAGAGTVLATLEVGRDFDHALEEQVPLYAELIAPHHRPWENPEEGVLAGRVVLVADEFVLLQTLRGDEWIVVLMEEDYNEVEENRLIRAVGERRAYTELTIDWSEYFEEQTEINDEYVFYASHWKQRAEDSPFGRKKPGKHSKNNNVLKAQFVPAN